METIRVRRQQSNKSDRNVIARKLGQLAASDPRQKFKKSYIATKNTARRSGKEIRRVGPVDAAAVFSDESQSIRKPATCSSWQILSLRWAVG